MGGRDIARFFLRLFEIRKKSRERKGKGERRCSQIFSSEGFLRLQRRVCGVCVCVGGGGEAKSRIDKSKLSSICSALLVQHS